VIPLYGSVRRPGIPGWTPATANPIAWWYANSTYVEDATPPVADGDDVVTWLDRSGNVSTLTWNTSKPKYRANGFNTGKPAVEFVNTNDSMGSAPNLVTTHCSGTSKPFSAFFTVQLDSTTSRVQGLMSVTDSAGPSSIQLEINAAGKLRYQMVDTAGNGAVVVGNAAVSTGHHRLGFIYDGAALSAWIDGVLDITAVDAQVGALSLDQMGMGISTYAPTPNALDGMIREAIFLNYAASSSVWNAFRAYSISDSGA
jgi:hypothetical protein